MQWEQLLPGIVTGDGAGRALAAFISRQVLGLVTQVAREE